MAATIPTAATQVRAALAEATATMDELANYPKAHPELQRMEIALAAMERRAADLIVRDPDHDDLGPIADDLASLDHCAANWIWANDNFGWPVVTCGPVLDRHAPTLPLMFAQARPLAA